MDDAFAKEHGLMTDAELSKMDERFRKREEEGLKNVLKHFDRIHDKLFTFNNILITGYFALSKLVNSVPVAAVIVPLINLAFLIWIEYRMMEKSRFESNITERPVGEFSKYGDAINRTNLYSLLSIVTTAVVTMLFLYFLLFKR